MYVCVGTVSHALEPTDPLVVTGCKKSKIALGAVATACAGTPQQCVYPPGAEDIQRFP
jgi:hypothetical protein